MSIRPEERFRRSNPCPVCGGYPEAPHGRGVRCWGFLSTDGAYAHCTREERGGSLHPHDGSSTYAHRLTENCTCGAQHGDTGRAVTRGRIWCLRHPNGAIVEHHREDRADGSKRTWWSRAGKPGLGGLRVEDLPLYGADVLREVPKGMRLVVVEGEKSLDALRARGIGAVATVTGAKVIPTEESLRPLLDYAVVLWPDADTDGGTHMRRLAERLRAMGHENVRTLDWPDAPGAGDAADFFASGGTGEGFDALAAAATPSAFGPEGTASEGSLSPATDASSSTKGSDRGADDAGERKQQAAILVNLAADAELFHTPDEDAYAHFAVGGHRETWRIRGRRFQRWLARRFYIETHKAPNDGAMHDAFGVLEGKALYDGDEHVVFTRIAKYHERTMFLDLVNESWQAVEISPDGWRVVNNPPVRFRRANGMLPLPAPEAGGSIDELRGLLNVPGETEWVLVVSWLLGALRPERPYPVLVLQGEQGSAKSTTARFLRALVDPNEVPLRAEPREVRDLMIAATNAYAIVFDNLSHLTPWLSDALCRLATGGGFATRELYTDREEILFQADRPVLINGIEELATRGDLLDRSLVISLPPIPEDRRQEERKLVGEFERLRPRLLGALLDATVVALRDLDATPQRDLPRMADFAVWVIAAERSLGWPPGTFMSAYTANRQTANEVALEASLIADLILQLATKGGFAGTATELLRVLGERADAEATRKRGWPQTPSHLSNLLKRLAPNLRAAGVEVEWTRGTNARRARRIRIWARLSAEDGVRSVQSVHSGQEDPAGVDGPDGEDGVRDITQGDTGDAEDLMLRAARDLGLAAEE